jgi:ribosomal protein S18 acetylase RimI-like enzyme
MTDRSLKLFDERDSEQVIRFWNAVCDENDVVYKPFTRETFTKTFPMNPNFDTGGMILLWEGEELIGLACGIYRKESLPGESLEALPGYLTAVMVRSDRRGAGYGRMLVERVENYLRQNGKREIRVDFFNPIRLEWLIPGSPGYDHPNAPGADMAGPGYEFLKRMGYAQRAVEEVMVADLKTFRMPASIPDKDRRLRENDIAIELYDDQKHTGLQSFFDRLKNEHWRNDINGNLSLERPFPFLVAASKGAICGFAGPLEIEPSGRGRFCGIGVDPGFEGRGIGTILFFKLCESFKEIGASFMSLFTGENNKAKNIYSSAGFEVVRRWALFAKSLTNEFDVKR